MGVGDGLQPHAIPRKLHQPTVAKQEHSDVSASPSCVRQGLFQSNSSDMFCKNCFLYKTLRINFFDVCVHVFFSLIFPSLHSSAVGVAVGGQWGVGRPPPHPCPNPLLHNPASFSLCSLNPFAGVFLEIWHHANEHFLSVNGWQLLGCLSTDNPWKTAPLFIFTRSHSCINNRWCHWQPTLAGKGAKTGVYFVATLCCCLLFPSSEVLDRVQSCIVSWS